LQILTHSALAGFWSAEYRERPIAILYRHGRVHVHRDHVLQLNVVFESSTDALVWLIQCIDQRIACPWYAEYL
jgi:hypothetical protein